MIRRKRRWPSIDLYQDGGSTGAIKTTTAPELERLMSRAAATSGWSATGRPAWFAEHRDEFVEALVVVFGPEGGRGVVRCIVTVILQDDSGGRFMLDMLLEAFDALDDLSDRATALKVHDDLGAFPHIDVPGLPPAQESFDWDKSVWKTWGEPPAGCELVRGEGVVDLGEGAFRRAEVG